MREELSVLIQAQYPLIYLVTFEEDRAERTIATLAQRQPQRRLYTWTMTHGVVEYGHERGSGQQNNTVSPQAAINWAMRQKDPSIFVFKDLHPFKDSPEVTRSLRDAIESFRGTQKTIILMSPVQEVPVELEKEVVVLDFSLPSMSELNQVLTAELSKSGVSGISTEGREKLLKAALGLTRDEGGMEELKHWLKQRSNAFTERAREYGLPQPKGMLILGVPGCGKSLIAKTTARLWGLPLLRLDMGRVYDGSMVGRSEANLRGALKTAESISPAVLFIDEIDKAFAGSAGSADSDGGTSSRIFGSFLTWMQEKTSPVFVIATANRVERLPREFLR